MVKKLDRKMSIPGDVWRGEADFTGGGRLVMI